VGGVVGLIAGGGALPLALARGARARGRRVTALAFRGTTHPEIEALVDSVVWIYPGQVSAALDALEAAGAGEAVLAGAISKSALLSGGESLQLDARARAELGALPDRRDETLYGAILAVLAERGIRLLAQMELAPELLGGEGPLGSAQPTQSQQRDFRVGWRAARALAALDVGQTVVVKQGSVVALEAAEGTDSALRRGGSLAPGACAVKMARPQQDPRFDLPTLGPETARVAVESGIAAIAFEAGRTLVLERERLREIADAAGVPVVGWTEDAAAGSTSGAGTSGAENSRADDRAHTKR